LATEPFLINPPRSLGRRRRRNPVGETLVTIGANPMRRRRRNPENPWFGDPVGHRIAALMRWGKIPKGRIREFMRVSRRKKVGRPRKVYKRMKVHRRIKVYRKVHRKRGRRWAPRHIRRRRLLAKHAFWATKYGFMLAHPRSKKVFTRKGFITMAKHRRRKNTWFGQPRRHRRAAKKGWRRGHLLWSSTGRSRRRVRHNPVGANPRRRRRNPALTADFGRFTSSLMNVRGWAPLAVTGGLSAITGAVAPGMLGIIEPWTRLGVQTVVAIGGGLIVDRVVDKRHGEAWMIVGVSMVGYQLLKQFVLIPYFPQFAVGLGDYQDYYPDSSYVERDQVSQQVGAFPNQMGAFVNAYPGVGEEVGAYPYDGSYTPY